MPYTVKQHATLARHFYVNGILVGGASDAQDAIRVYQAAQDAGDSDEG